jgi:hypothetical protein
LRRLRKGVHHCRALQSAFDGRGSTKLSFVILEDGVKESDLRSREYHWSKELNGVNQWPAKLVKAEMKGQVLADLAGGMRQRDIAKKFGISLGLVSRIKTTFEARTPSVYRR